MMDYQHGGEAREFLQNAVFSPDNARRLFPNAERHLRQGLFISHAGVDSAVIITRIVLPVLTRLWEGEWYFLHSRRSGGAGEYRQLVQAALHWCDKFMVVVTPRSLANEWVTAEVEWALERGRPIVAVGLDGCGWDDMIRELDLPAERTSAAVATIDLSQDIDAATQALSREMAILVGRLPLGISALE